MRGKRAIVMATFGIVLAAAAPPRSLKELPWSYPPTVGNPDGTERHVASCATADTSITVSGNAISYWILGFWSGMNNALGKQIGRTTDTAGLLGEVKLYCDAHPSATVTEASLMTYLKFETEHR